MAKPNKKKQVKTDVVPNPTEPSSVTGGQTTWYPSGEDSYVVTRDGLRVSDKSYCTADEEQAVNEADFWRRVTQRYPDGTKVEIVKFDKKKHRIWHYE